MNLFICRNDVAILNDNIKLHEAKLILTYTKRRDSDEELLLLERISNGEEDALSELYDMYSAIIYSLIIKIVKNNEEAEDLMQSLFIKIWERASSFDRTKGNVYSWLTALARNSAIDKIRSKQYKTNRDNLAEIDEAEIFGIKEGLTGIDSAIINERTQYVSKALEEIPVEQRAVIKLAYFEGLTQSEMAEALSIPLGTVKTRMRQALIKLEKILSPFIES